MGRQLSACPYAALSLRYGRRWYESSAKAPLIAPHLSIYAPYQRPTNPLPPLVHVRISLAKSEHAPEEVGGW